MADKDDKEIIVIPDPEITDKDDLYSYGKYSRRSRICVVCNSANHAEINLLRAKHHKTFNEISIETGINLDILKLHFSKHFTLFPSAQKLLNLKERNNPEANELIAMIFDGNVDIYAGAMGVLESKGARLLPTINRINELTDAQENNLLEESELFELDQLHKRAEDIENSILKTYQIIDKKLFPVSREDLSSAIINYKLNIASKMLDEIQTELFKLEMNPEDANTIVKLRQSLRYRFNSIEEDILKSGGIMMNTQEIQKEEEKE